MFQTIHGLIDAEDDKGFAGGGGLNERKERELREDSRRVRADINSDELASRERQKDRSA